MNTNIVGLPVIRLLTFVLAPLLLGTSLRTACNHIVLPAAGALLGFINAHGLITPRSSYGLLSNTARSLWSLVEQGVLSKRRRCPVARMNAAAAS
jgi:hypothetical protein